MAADPYLVPRCRVEDGSGEPSGGSPDTLALPDDHSLILDTNKK
jgi:hypothetical protein